MKNGRYQILLTNDDGIQSPGLWAAAAALSKIGFVTVTAPRDQASSTGRSLPITSDGRITTHRMRIGEQEWTVHAIGGTPAQTVLHGVLEIIGEKPDLVVSGINYGENVSDGITISGTVGAAMEGASLGIPSMAVSLQLLDDGFYTYSETVDFSTAAHFTTYFAQRLLEKRMPRDVNLIKVDVPAMATPATPWRITRQAVLRYFHPVVTRKGALEEPGPLGYKLSVRREEVPEDTDIYALIFDKVVSVTPLSLDMTARVDFNQFDKLLRPE
jgi:5'-nucleotidase